MGSFCLSCSFVPVWWVHIGDRPGRTIAAVRFFPLPMFGCLPPFIVFVFGQDRFSTCLWERATDNDVGTGIFTRTPAVCWWKVGLSFGCLGRLCWDRIFSCSFGVSPFLVHRLGGVTVSGSQVGGRKAWKGVPRINAPFESFPFHNESIFETLP